MFGKRRRESLCASNIATEDNKMTTVLRIRPTAGIDNYDDNYLRINQTDSEVTLIPPELRPGAQAEKFKFDQILGPEVQQPEVFKNTVNKLVKAAFDGKSACLFAYGASGSGKTHTMMGKPSDPGVIPRTLELLFKAVGGKIDENEQLIATGSCSVRKGTRNQLKENEKARLEVRQLAKGASSKKGPRRSLTSVPDEPFQQSLEDVDLEIDNDSTYVIYASFYELYNEKVYDLLVPLPKDKKRVALSVKKDQKGAFVNKLRQIRINSPHEALTLLKAGQQGLTTGATRLNSDSSRSHCLFTLRIARKVNEHAFQVSNLAFCDLAGTERLGKETGPADQIRLAESKTINKSLMQLRLVISDLQKLQKNGNKVVCFRNSKLTQLMEPYLVGHSMTSIIITLSSNPEDSNDTKRSLEFASTAQQIKIDRHEKHEEAAKPLSRDPSVEEKVEQQEEKKIDDPYGVGTDFADWSKQDVIDDLVYYMHCVKERDQCIQRMKIAWQKDEREYEERHNAVLKQHISEFTSALRMLEKRIRTQDDDLSTSKKRIRDLERSLETSENEKLEALKALELSKSS